MNLEKMRLEMSQYRTLVSEEAMRQKQSSFALEKLSIFYRELPKNYASMADQIISEWVLSDDEGMRFDALALIDEFDILTAELALQELFNRLILSASPGAPYERQKVIRIQKKLFGR